MESSWGPCLGCSYFPRILLAALVVADGTRPQSMAHAATFTVNATDDTDDGACNGSHCSLREALIAANAAPGFDTIDFSIPGPGPHTITLDSALPPITDPITIDGTTEPGYTGIPTVVISGSPNGDMGLQFTPGASGSRLAGVSLVHFDPYLLDIAFATNIVIEDNYLGLYDNGSIVIEDSARGAVHVVGGGSHVFDGNTMVALVRLYLLLQLVIECADQQQDRCRSDRYRLAPSWVRRGRSVPGLLRRGPYQQQ